MNEFEKELLARIDRLEAEVKKTQKEDPGYEFARLCAAGGPIWWSSQKFQIEEKYQAELKRYENSWVFKLFFKPPTREDGSTIKYNDMKSDDFYGWSK